MVAGLANAELLEVYPVFSKGPCILVLEWDSEKQHLPVCCVCDTLITMKTAVVHARMDPQTKKKAEGLLHKLGLTPTEAIRIFYRQITLRGGLPFNVAIPNDLTAKTLLKSREGKEVQKFDSLDNMFENWEA